MEAHGQAVLALILLNVSPLRPKPARDRKNEGNDAKWHALPGSVLLLLYEPPRRNSAAIQLKHMHLAPPGSFNEAHFRGTP